MARLDAVAEARARLEKRIDVSHAMILVAMGGNLIRRNAHPSQMGFSDRGADCKFLFGLSMFLPALWFSSRLTL
ncbi:hypothetical protein X751_16590 [Mesorhizobium sp. LNJC395A00]|nr:hypothetical protein X751_16590 [Mesorhizobium sp. LNJC395A00]